MSLPEFRGIKNTGDFVYGSLVCSKNIQPAIYFEIGKGLIKSFDWCYVKPETIGQYVGRKDIKKCKIFKGDIIEAHIIKWETATTGSIEFDINNSCWCSKNDAGLTPLYHLSCIEVIGNIHQSYRKYPQNPELIGTAYAAT